MRILVTPPVERMRVVPPEPGPGIGRRAGWLRRLYLTLRTEHTTPGKIALAVGLGIFVGCSPFWGLHLALCMLLARMFRLNRMLLYASANIANPLTAPVLVFAEVQIGHVATKGTWLGLTVKEVTDAGVTGLSLDLLVGGLAVGIVLGSLLGVIAFLLGRGDEIPEAYQRLVDEIVRRYLDVSIRDAEAARASLLKDPTHLYLLEEPSFGTTSRVLDLGCGRGVVASLGTGIRARLTAGGSYLGVDVSSRHVRVAREALGDLPGQTFQVADLRDFDPPIADLVLLLNTLRFLPPAAQDALLRRIAKALPAGAKILVHEVDAEAGWRFRVLVLGEFLSSLMPGRPHHRVWYRRAADLRNAMIAVGFEVRDHMAHHGLSPVRVFLEGIRKPSTPRPA